MDGLEQDDQQIVAGHPLEALADGIHFDPGARYEDHQADDPAATLGLEGFITGPKPEKIKASDEAIQQGIAHMNKQRDLNILVSLGRGAVMLLMLVGVWFARRQLKATQGKQSGEGK